MIIGIPRETRDGETRVAATPETVKKLAASGKHSIVVEAGAGVASSIPDPDFQSAGAHIGMAAQALGADIVLKVRGPAGAELAQLKRGAMLVGLLNPFDAAAVRSYADAGISGFALEKLPRITRAQSMDVLSSQANIAGYKAVMMAGNTYGRFMPMLMTAAGTVKAARVLVLGVGVAGLDVERLLIVRDSVRQPSLPHERVPPVHMRVRVVRVDRERAPVIVDPALGVAAARDDHAEVVERLVIVFSQ